MKSKHLTTIVPLLVSLLIPTTAMPAPAVKAVEVNGVRLSYMEQGSGEPAVFVHGAPSDLRTWEPVREAIAKKYRFIAYTQRYFGTEPWPDEGKNFSIATLADDLATFITSLNAGPVHLVGWSYGGVVAMPAAVKNPSLVRSLILYEPCSSSPCCRQTAPREKRRAKIAPSCLPRRSPRTRPVTLSRQPSY